MVAVNSIPAEFAASKILHHKQVFDPHFSHFFDNLNDRIDLPGSSRWSRDSLGLLQKFSLSGGKRQRVAFMYEACGLTAGHSNNIPTPEDQLNTAISIELLQSHLLIHDDLIDESDLRRGQPTFHVELQESKSQAQARSVALLVGDIASYLAIWPLLNTSDAVRAKLISTQLNAGLETFWGQIFDLERDDRGDFSKHKLIELADFKAVRSSTFAPMLLGLVLASADSRENIKRVRDYSFAAGIAGQLQDDYLSIFGDSSVTGKSVLADLKEGKRTLMVTHTVERCDGLEQKKLNKILGNHNITPSDAEWCRELFKKYEADDMIRRESIRWAHKAQQVALGWEDWDRSSVDFFISVASWLAEREL